MLLQVFISSCISSRGGCVRRWCKKIFVCSIPGILTKRLGCFHNTWGIGKGVLLQVGLTCCTSFKHPCRSAEMTSRALKEDWGLRVTKSGRGLCMQRGMAPIEEGDEACPLCCVDRAVAWYLSCCSPVGLLKLMGMLEADAAQPKHYQDNLQELGIQFPAWSSRWYKLCVLVTSAPCLLQLGLLCWHCLLEDCSHLTDLCRGASFSALHVYCTCLAIQYL